MNIGLIFAGGSGSRMNTKSRPKQFLLLNGKPIIIYTIEVFENHPDIDVIIVVCLESWIPYLNKELARYDIQKVVKVVPGGMTGPESIHLGLKAADAYCNENSEADRDIVLIHDGVRPLVYEQTISDNIATVRKLGSCITTVSAIETIIVNKQDGGLEVPKRSDVRFARAPQSFYLDEILGAYDRRQKDGIPEFIDSCSLMNYYGYSLGTIEGPMENIKITTPTDFYMFRAMVESLENQQILGLF